ncbi:MAG: hypothetical protein ACXVGH_13705, partial [Mycobacteriales bacterium]
ARARRQGRCGVLFASMAILSIEPLGNSGRRRQADDGLGPHALGGLVRGLLPSRDAMSVAGTRRSLDPS